ncbi:MAG TPA: hypothetical protein VKR06_30140 [Ktedonosporobacter sp.]|nr:hypothetical protein [Ktedonosporobacter sp.]
MATRVYGDDAIRERTRPRRSCLVAIVVLLLLVASLVWLTVLRSRLPAASALVTITPLSTNYSRTYTISEGVRAISSTTPTESLTVKATGTQHQDATAATGAVYVNPGPGGSFAPGVLHLVSHSGMSITITISASFPLCSATCGAGSYSAQADQPGPAGNIPAYEINGTYYDEIGNPYTAYNDQPFSGGQDGYDYSVVQQSDIDNAANTLETRLASQSNVAQKSVQKQVHQDEQLVDTIQCNPVINSNHQAFDRAIEVTVSVKIVCQDLAYNPLIVQIAAEDLLKSNARADLGANYLLVGRIATTTPVTEQQSVGSTGVSVVANGIWVFQFGSSQRQKLASLIAGKSVVDATAQLQQQNTIVHFNIQTSGFWGNAIPASPEDIKFVIINVPGF